MSNPHGLTDEPIEMPSNEAKTIRAVRCACPLLNEAEAEAASRQLCALIGIDPDEQLTSHAFPEPNSRSALKVVTIPRWKTVEGDVRSSDMRRFAIETQLSAREILQ